MGFLVFPPCKTSGFDYEGFLERKRFIKTQNIEIKCSAVQNADFGLGISEDFHPCQDGNNNNNEKNTKVGSKGAQKGFQNAIKKYPKTS